MMFFVFCVFFFNRNYSSIFDNAYATNTSKNNLQAVSSVSFRGLGEKVLKFKFDKLTSFGSKEEKHR